MKCPVQFFQNRKATYNGATPDELMETLFLQSSCSYRVLENFDKLRNKCNKTLIRDTES